MSVKDGGRCCILICLIFASSSFSADALPLSAAPSPLLKLWGKEPSTAAAQGYQALDAGELEKAEASFNAAITADKLDAAALSGLARLAASKNQFQRELELHCAAVVAAYGASPLAESEIEAAFSVLRFCKDPARFRGLILHTYPFTQGPRDTLDECNTQWFIDAGNYAEAAKASAHLNYVSNFMLIGPFDNRDKAGFEAVQEPEKNIDVDKESEGRSRRVRWQPLNAATLDGRIWLNEIFEPNIHALAYAATLVKVWQDTPAFLHAGCAGALKAWVNGELVGAISEYNDYGADKVNTHVMLRRGWNLIVLKSAVEEETQWGFSLRLSAPNNRLDFFKTADDFKTALAEWKVENPKRPALALPEIADERLDAVLRAHILANPNDALALASYGALMESHKLGEARNASSDAPSSERYLRAAIALAPKNPLYRIQLANLADDNNEARVAAESVAKTHPDLPALLETQISLADKSRLEIKAEELARNAWKSLGAERCGDSALALARIRAEKGERAEAWAILKQFNEQHPYHAAAWNQRIDWEDSSLLRQAATEKALSFCGGDRALIAKHIDDLERLGKSLEAARLAASNLSASPFSVSAVRFAASEYRRAGYLENARRIIDAALRNAPEQPELLALSAHLKHHAGHPAEAAALLKRALELKPNAPEYKDYLALLDAGKTLDREFFAPYDIALKDLPVPNAADFPKDNIVKMLNQEVVRVNPNGSASRMIHIVGKILRTAGIAELQNHQIYYEPNRQTVDILRAAVITPDGRELSRASVRDRSTSAAMGVETLIYDEHHLKQVSFSDLEPGCIVDLQYTIRDHGDNIYGDYFADSFYFNDGHALMRAQYVLDYPKSLPVQSKTHGTAAPAQRVETHDPARETVKWELVNMAGVKREFSMPPLVDGLAQLQLSTMKSWQEVGAWFWNLARDQVVVNEEMRREIAIIIKDAKSDTDKLRAIHDWVIRKIRYLGIEFGRNGYKPHKAIESYKALYGDCKDTATLITAMLKSIGIDSKLVLIRTVNSGAISPDSLPMPNLYNHCIAYVPNVDGKAYWIDGTTDFYRLGEVPSADRGANVLVAGPEGGAFMKIPQSLAEENRIEQAFDVGVTKTGSAKMTLKDTRSGQFAPILRESIETPGRFERSMKDYAARRFNGAELKKIKSSDPLDQGPAWSEIEIDVPSLGSSSGDRLSLPACFEPLNLTQRYAPEPRRVNDIQFYTPWSRKTTIRYVFEPGMKISSLPKEERLTLPSGRYSRSVKQNGNELLIDELLEFPSTRIPAAEYDAFKNLCQRVDELLDQKVLIQN